MKRDVKSDNVRIWNYRNKAVFRREKIDDIELFFQTQL